MTHVVPMPSPRPSGRSRLANAYLVDGVCVVDPWEGIGLPSSVRCVALTHSHGDHVTGLDELIAQGVRLVDGPPGWDVISTPGHCSPHRAFWCDEILIAGDTIEGAGGGAPLITHATGGDMSAHMTVTRLLVALDVRVALPGHGGTIHDPARAYGTLLEYRLEHEARIRGMPDRKDDQIAALLYPGHEFGAELVAAHRAKILSETAIA